MKLYAPEAFWELTKEARKRICNGCGAADSTFDLVPDTIYGLRVSEVCNIHDFMYNAGKTLADKEAADRAMLNNLIRFINANTKKGWMWGWLRNLRRKRAHIYYFAVKHFGGPAYWSGKNSPEEERDA